MHNQRLTLILTETKHRPPPLVHPACRQNAALWDVFAPARLLTVIAICEPLCTFSQYRILEKRNNFRAQHYHLYSAKWIILPNRSGHQSMTTQLIKRTKTTQKYTCMREEIHNFRACARICAGMVTLLFISVKLEWM